ncbi:hypothetical protein GCM10011498_38850 [Amylibacter cionae]|uniref:Uncharacterized protein n=1 Tax=Neptunicoccus cionae TaxID=2035344 RepID=A0A916R488_9RHOB|nr:hypothetical protein GCM10011498_38850 [Amylibacter cionae]
MEGGSEGQGAFVKKMSFRHLFLKLSQNPQNSDMQIRPQLASENPLGQSFAYQCRFAGGPNAELPIFSSLSDTNLTLAWRFAGIILNIYWL